MASITNTSTTNSTLNSLYGIKSNGIGGLASGLDTDSLIDAMTTSTRSKIAKQQQKKQSLAWKMTGLQSISQKLLDFSNKYISMTSSSSLRSSNLFNTKVITPNGTYADNLDITGTANGDVDFTIKSATRVKNALTSSKNVASNYFSTEAIDLTSDKYVDALEGATMTINYDGEEYTVTMPAYNQDANGNSNTATRTAAEMETIFNNALQNVETKTAGKPDGGKLSDKIEIKLDGSNQFTLQNKASNTDPKDMKITGGSGSLLHALGMEKTKTAASSITGPSSFDGTDAIWAVGMSEMQNKDIMIQINGTSKKINTGSFSNLNDLAANLQKNIDKAFGKTGGGTTSRVSVTAGSDGKLTFKSNDSDDVVKLTGGDSALIGKNKAFGIAYGSNHVDTRDKLNELKIVDPTTGNAVSPNKITLSDGSQGYGLEINGEQLYFSENDSVSSMLDKINKSGANIKASYSADTGQFTFESNLTGQAGSVVIRDIDASGNAVSGGLADTLFNGISDSYGADAKLELEYSNGQVTTLKRDTNNFDVDGMTISVNRSFTAANANDNVSLTVASNSDEIVKVVKSMVEDFNNVIGLINTELETKPDRNYTPLSDEQKKEMTEKEITEWETKAKKGSLFGDTDLRSLSSDLRFIFSSGVDGVGFFKDIGINIGSSYTDNGKISLDETKLRQALEQDPDKVKKMFTQDGTGVADVLKNTVEKYAKSEGYYKGILVSRAGIADQTSETNSSMNKQITDIDSVIKSLKEKLEAEVDRYQKQFTNLERVISQLNSQSSWLSQQS